MGLQPEGIDLYAALTSGYRTFDRLELLASEARVDLNFDDSLPAEKRLVLITDANDNDFLTLNSWTVDETGAFQRNSAAALAGRRFSDDAIVLNAIGMTYVEGSLPDERTIALAEDQSLRERYSRGFNMAIELQNIASAAGGIAYLDRFEIPLGSLSRQMTAYRDDGVQVRLPVQHRFFPGEATEVLQPSPLPGFAIAPAKAGARSVLEADYQPESGQGLELGVWTEWLTDLGRVQAVVSSRNNQITGIDDANAPGSGDTGEASADAGGEGLGIADSALGRLSYGGPVSVLTSTLREDPQERAAFSDNPLYHIGFARMLDWLARSQPRDVMRFQAHRADERAGDTIEVQLNLRSSDGLSLTSPQLSLWQIETDAFDDLESADLARDGMPQILTEFADQPVAQVPLSVVDQSTPGLSGSNLILRAQLETAEVLRALNSDEAVLVDIQAQGVSTSGVARDLSYRLFLYPNQLLAREERASWLAGLNQALLRTLAGSSGGAYIAPGEPIELQRARQPEPQIVVVSQDWRWILALIMIGLMILDFLVREYRLGRVT